MSATSMGAGSKQVVKPPQRGIFPLDHFAECQAPMQQYLECLHENKDLHHKCRDLSKEYLQCRMDRGLMSSENLNKMGFGEDQQVKGAREYDYRKEKEGFVAGKHIQREPNSWSLFGRKKNKVRQEQSQTETETETENANTQSSE